jgi:Fe2+ or Zn2+ uptake regulation protein
MIAVIWPFAGIDLQLLQINCNKEGRRMSDLMVEAERVLRGSGGRMTAQRRAIIEALDQVGGHPTAEEVYSAARSRDDSINPSTVYRTFSWLEQAGLLSPAWFGPERSRRQEPTLRTLPPEHHHFVCANCGAVIEFATPAVEEIKTDFAAEHGVSVTRAVITLYGLCPDCQAGQNYAPVA